MIRSGDSALREIENRLTEIYNEMRFLREDNAACAKTITINNDKLALLDRMESDYVALLVPQQEGIPA